MRVQGESLFCAFTFITLIEWSRLQEEQECDTGQTKLEMDLPPSDELLCPNLRPPSLQRLSDIYTTYSVQPGKQICMNETITYKHAIPNSGAHRPVAAQSGEYLYCPPQRWINNLQDGAIVLLVHPCVSEHARRSLVLMACSCLPEFILTSHPQLSQHRPFALVSWGRTLEMSHLTKAAVCDWLETAFFNFTRMTENQKPKYSLYLKRAAPMKKALHTYEKSVVACCLDALSTYKQTELRGRRIRAAPSSTKVTVMRNHEVELAENPAHNGSMSKPQNVSADLSSTVTLNNDSNSKMNGDGKVEPNNEPAAGKILNLQPQSSSRREKEQENVGSTTGAQSEVKSHKKDLKHVVKQSVTTDAEEPGHGHSCEALGNCDPPEAHTPALQGPLQGRKMASWHRNEAVWAAAALSFLLGLLAISILHTRLYRHWRKPASLYWQECNQDYDSVADIIRRRLKMMGRKKRRVSQSRRKECPLLSDLSTDNDSD